MALHFLLDGYNIIKQRSEFADLAIDVGRQRLIRMIEQKQPQGSRRNEITIFFDGKPGRSSPPVSATVKVLFSYETSADDLIKTLVADAPTPRHFVVVTDDREIQYHVRAHGAAVWTVQEFMNKMGAKRTVQAPSEIPGTLNVSSGKTISKVLEEQINTELEKIWLEKRKSS